MYVLIPLLQEDKLGISLAVLGSFLDSTVRL